MGADRHLVAVDGVGQGGAVGVAVRGERGECVVERAPEAAVLPAVDEAPVSVHEVREARHVRGIIFGEE